MLTGKHVRVRFARDCLVPLYLDANERQWLDVAEQLLGVFRTSAGARRGQLGAEIDELFGDLPQPLIHNGLTKLLEDRCEFEMHADFAPEDVRAAAFQAAAQKRKETLEQIGHSFSRADIVNAVATDLQTDVPSIEASLFADLKSEQRLTEFHDTTASRLLERYNVALAQALLLRATGVKILLRGDTPAHYRQLFREIKFRRLLYDIEPAGENSYQLRLDGPLSLFSATQKYGLQLALVLPTLLLCKHFELDATLRWGAERKEKRFQLSHRDGLVSHQAEIGAFVPPEAQMFVELFQKKIPDWEISAQAELIPLGNNVWVPDHRLVHRDTGNVVLLDILGFWRRSSAERHLTMLRQYAGAPFVVAISDQLNVDDADLESLPDHVVRFRNMPLPEEIVKRASRLIE